MMAGSSSSATVAVEKATSDLLMGPDWTMNIEICDSINSNHWQPKDVVKAVKKRIQHKSSKVQILALTLLETMVKNCGDYVHFQITDRNVLEEMIKIVRKKANMQVRDKILILLDSWQEAFGGAGGKYPQYYWAYEELKRSGVSFPPRSPDAAPIFTPPPTHPSVRNTQPGYGMPSSSSKTLDETMATEIESLSMSSLESMRHVLDLLSDMLQAVNPNDRVAVKDEVIVDLVDRCRTNQKKLMHLLTTTGDEELLGRGLELNDNIQSLLARHDAIASGTSYPIHGASPSSSTPVSPESVNQTEVKSSSASESVSTPKASPPAAVYSETRGESDEEEEDEFAQIARRHSKTQSVTSKDSTVGSSENLGLLSTSSTTPYVPESSTSSVPSNALALPDPPAPISTSSRDQDIIDLLSLTLSLAPSSPPTATYAPSSAPTQGSMHQIPVSSSADGYFHSPQTYPGNSPFNNYVAPWAQQPQPKSEFQTQLPQQTYQSQSPQHIYQPQPQPTTPPSPQQFHAHYESEQLLHQQHNRQPQSELPQSQLQNQHLQYSPHQHNEPQLSQYQPQQYPHLQRQPQPQPQPQPQLQMQSQHRPQHQHQPQQPMQIQSQQSQQQPQFQNQHGQYPARYPPPPWAATPGYANYQSHSSASNAISTSQGINSAASYPPAQGVRPLQHNLSFPLPGVDPRGGNSGQRPFVPSYKLFEDLNVFGNSDGRVSGAPSNVSGAMGPGMVGGGRK
ncbi:TOM1-like protein 6 [Vicia villosa]|uniref:TOM1-like protein 6 n=1 Tax=Vicia villosa TaxID=3911 RepID=UPI00273ABA15|nr:TOM1-like protein 6 [Vicia villosa]